MADSAPGPAIARPDWPGLLKAAGVMVCPEDGCRLFHVTLNRDGKIVHIVCSKCNGSWRPSFGCKIAGGVMPAINLAPTPQERTDGEG